MGIPELRKKYNRGWVGRRFLDFRQGHALYLAFFVNFLTFGTVVYALAIERIEILKTVFPNIGFFIGFFVVTYIPIAILIGDWHIKHQMKVEARKGVENNPYTWFAQQGKESLYSLPSGITNLEIQKKSMAQQNAIADTLNLMIEQQNQLARAVNEFAEQDNSVTIHRIDELSKSLIPKFTEQEFAKVNYLRRVATFLKDGRSVTEAVLLAETPEPELADQDE